MATISLVFKKKLRKTDINRRLSIPSHCLSSLPEFEQGRNQTSLRAVDDDSNEWWFKCLKRKNGYSKPVFSKGWMGFVRNKRLSVGDVVVLYRVDYPVMGVWYGIRATRTTNQIRLFGINIKKRA